MLCLVIYFNYFHSLERITGATKLRINWFVFYYLLFFVPFALAYFLQPLFYKGNRFFKNKWFWIILFIAPAIFSFRVNFTFHHPLVQQIWNGDEQLFWLHCTRWLVGLLAVILPVYIIWKIKDSMEMPFYGIRKIDNTKPYLIMILCMIPFIVLAALQADFLKMYPRAKIIDGWELHPKVIYILIHEVLYSLDFITIEIFFRGFLVISLVNICGRQCIVPAACFY